MSVMTVGYHFDESWWNTSNIPPLAFPEQIASRASPRPARDPRGRRPLGGGRPAYRDRGGAAGIGRHAPEPDSKGRGAPSGSRRAHGRAPPRPPRGRPVRPP